MDADERRARATAEASAWWARLAGRQPHEISRAEREQFTTWLRESPLHVAEMLHMAHVHDALERFKLWGEVPAESTAPEANVIPIAPEKTDQSQTDAARRQRARRATPRWIAVAAACLAIVVLGGLFLASRGDVFATERTERRTFMLNDGSVVQLEPESTLRVRFDRHERRVILESGRALFRIAKNPQRPFLVQADATTVRALGTAFGVEHRAGGIVVTVAEGTVAVTPQDPARTSSSTRAAPQLLTAGQQLTLQASGTTERVRRVDTQRALAWTEGRLVFENDTLADVIAEFNRYNRRQLRIADPQLAARRVSGVFEATDTETLLAFISAGNHVTLDRKGDDEISIAVAP